MSARRRRPIILTMNSRSKSFRRYVLVDRGDGRPGLRRLQLALVCAPPPPVGKSPRIS
jgi:hypothetical protein